MFTGIVTDVGRVTEVVERNDLRRISVECSYDAATIAVGASIACAGVCLTVVSVAEGGRGAIFDVEAAPETLLLTNARAWKAGTRLNLERPLKVGDELGGHLVAGHVDGLATVIGRDEFGDSARLTLGVPHDLSRFIAPKGSVALDGTSLTVNEVSGDRFDCLIVPHTLRVTTWDERRVGDRVHLEVDSIARYVARLLEPV
jgi:riboflavin synthase